MTGVITGYHVTWSCEVSTPLAGAPTAHLPVNGQLRTATYYSHQQLYLSFLLKPTPFISHFTSWKYTNFPNSQTFTNIPRQYLIDISSTNFTMAPSKKGNTLKTNGGGDGGGADLTEREIRVVAKAFQCITAFRDGVPQVIYTIYYFKAHLATYLESFHAIPPSHCQSTNHFKLYRSMRRSWPQSLRTLAPIPPATSGSQSRRSLSLSPKARPRPRPLPLPLPPPVRPRVLPVSAKLTPTAPRERRPRSRVRRRTTRRSPRPRRRSRSRRLMFLTSRTLITTRARPRCTRVLGDGSL